MKYRSYDIIHDGKLWATEISESAWEALAAATNVSVHTLISNLERPGTVIEVGTNVCAIGNAWYGTDREGEAMLIVALERAPYDDDDDDLTSYVDVCLSADQSAAQAKTSEANNFEYHF